MRVSSRFMWVFLFLMFKTQVITAMEPSDVVEGSVPPALVPASTSTVGIITGIVDRRKNLNNRQFMAEEAEQWPDGFQTTLWPHIEAQIFGRIHAFLLEKQDILTVSGSAVVAPDTEDFVKGSVVGFKESTAAMFLAALQNRLADGSIAAIPSYFWQSTEVFLQNEVAGIVRCVHEAQKPFHGPAETRNFLLFRGQRENFCTNLMAEFEELVTNQLAKKVLEDNGHSVAGVFQDSGDSADGQGVGISMVAVGISIVPVEGADDEGEDGEPIQSNQEDGSGSATSSDQSDVEEDDEDEEEDEMDMATIQGDILMHWFQTQNPEALVELKDFIFDVPEEGQQ